LFMSLGSIAGVVGTYAILIPLTIFYGWPVEYLLYAFVGTLIIIYQHRDNIVRLFKGVERKLGQRRKGYVSIPANKKRTNYLLKHDFCMIE